eukprot:516876_1
MNGRESQFRAMLSMECDYANDELFIRDVGDDSKSNQSHGQYPQFISMPQLFQTQNECYWYVLCGFKDHDEIIDIPVHILLVEDHDKAYESFLRRKSTTHQYAYDVLFIAYDYFSSKAKVTQKKRRSKSKKKYFKQGQQSAHRHVFRQVLCDLYSKIMKVLIWTKFESCESRARQSRLRQHSVSWPIDEETWSIVGHEYLTLYANAEIRHGVSIHFTDLDAAKIFDINDNPLERTTMHGLFEAVDVLFAVNTKSLILTIWFNMKYTD